MSTTAAAPGVPRPSRRRYAAGCLGGSAVALAAFCWMITGGTWDFFESGINANFYDVQARALLAGHWNMPPAVLAIEGIVEHHKTYMYYGPVPAVLRMPVLLLTHRLDGRLTAVSMALAFAVALLFVGRLSWRIRSIVAGDRPVSRIEAAVAGISMVLVGAGSNLFFLASNTIIYHEAEIWGAALALGSFDFLVAFLAGRRLRHGLLAGVFATLAMLTRGSVGAGPVAAIGLAALVWAAAAVRWRQVGRRLSGSFGVAGTEPGPGITAVLMLVACALVPLVSYAVVNEVKFGTLFSLPLDKQVETAISAHRRATLAANGGSLFGIKFIPTALLAYIRPDALHFTRLFPFVTFPGPAAVIGHLRYDDRDWASSLTATMPLALLAGLIGLLGIFRPTRRGAHAAATGTPGVGVLRIPVIGAAVGTAGVLTIAFIANRYLADFVPLVAIASLTGLQLLYRFLRERLPVLRVTAALALGVLGLAGMWSNTALSLVYQRELRPGVPLSSRASFVSLQQHLDQSLFGNPPAGVIESRALRTRAPAGTLAIVGACAGLYESAGTGGGWDAVERSRAGGHFRLRVSRLPPEASHRWWPILVNGNPGSASYLALRGRGHGQYQFGYLFEGPGQRFVTGAEFAASPDRPHVIDATIDALVQEVTASLDGNVDFELGYFVRANRPVHVAANPLGGPVAQSFPAAVRQLPVPTPICHLVEHRLRRSP